ncbi:MAG: acylphosphatase [Chloroflexota bacterium]
MNHKSEKIRLHAIVRGTVQGVGFRMFVVDVAQRLSLTGWVRNRWDDTVEVTAEGEKPGLEALVEALSRGPRMAAVDKVDVEWLPATGEYKQFWITQMY